MDVGGHSVVAGDDHGVLAVAQKLGRHCDDGFVVFFVDVVARIEEFDLEGLRAMWIGGPDGVFDYLESAFSST